MSSSPERRIRRQFANAFPGRVFWIENGGGGTFGFPDALLAMDGNLVPIELKATYGNLRPSQNIVHTRLSDLDVNAFLLKPEGSGYKLIHTGTKDSEWFTDMTDLPKAVKSLQKERELAP